MRLYEHEAKRLFAARGLAVPVQYGVVTSAADLDKLENLAFPAMLKAAVLMGGRGKAGGVKKVDTMEEARAMVPEMLKLCIKGFPVERLAVESAVPDFSGACYVGVTMDPTCFRPILMVSASGGVEIEQVAKETPEAVLRVVLEENEAALPFEIAKDLAARLMKGLKLDDKALLDGIVDVITKVYAMFQEVDARLVEINPLLVSKVSGVTAVDAKVVLDDNALFRQGDMMRDLKIETMRHDVAEPTANEKRAMENKFPYVDLLPEVGMTKDANKVYVALVPGGAGYGIFSIDEVANVGERFFENRVVPVNFMDSGGGPPQARVAEMFHLMMDNPLVDLVITSRFGGISSCDVFIRGLILCLRTRHKDGRRMVPVYGRMVGTDLPNARAYLESASRETPVPLKDMKIIVGNQRIMVDVIREGVAAVWEKKGWSLPKGVREAVQASKTAQDGALPMDLPKHQRISADGGMLYHIVKKRRPELAAKIHETGLLETVVIGLGGAGTRHAGLMQQYGTNVTAAVAMGKGGTRIYETIPVYDTVKECLAEHPNIVAASIWRHCVTARDATLEVIEAGIPIVVLITEFVPLRDVREILVATKKHNTMLLGGNTPGLIFPPEGIKVGMLPDVFYPAEPQPGVFGPKGVTIVSRSGAILYHMSDALASVGIAQNAVLGVGGDGANGSTFTDLVPMAMEYPNTDLVVVAGEIGGMKEELLAADVKNHPERYPKPLIAMISGKHAPEGKTMGHAGAIVAPGQAFGTWQSKHDALVAAGVPVVNSQYDLILEAQHILGKDTKYFDPARYYGKMRTIWEAPPPKKEWGTIVTSIVPNSIKIAGYALQDIIPKKGYLETARLLVCGEFPAKEELSAMHSYFGKACELEEPAVRRLEGEDVSKTLAKAMLVDDALAQFVPAHGEHGLAAAVARTAFAAGRCVRYIAAIFGNTKALVGVAEKPCFGDALFRAVTGRKAEKAVESTVRLMEALVVASCDHGVTPPSAQATVLSATVRAAYEVAVAAGIAAITDVHGGAGAKAALFFARVSEDAAKKGSSDLHASAKVMMQQYIAEGKRVEGMGHRVHTRDPRRQVLWDMAASCQLAGKNVEVSKIAEEVFAEVRGMKLPINVDGVIGAIVADMGLDSAFAKVFFILGRVAGLSAHYYEEIASQTQMRRINFSEAVYRGHADRPLCETAEEREQRPRKRKRD